MHSPRIHPQDDDNPSDGPGAAARLFIMDLSPLRAVADRLDEVASVLRARAGHIALGAATARWYSPAARTYFGQIDEVTAQLSDCARRIDALAERVRRHIAPV